MARPRMRAVVLAIYLAMAGPAVSSGAETMVTYRSVPAEITRVSVYQWVEPAPPAAVLAGVDREGDRLTIRAPAGRRLVVLLERADGAYLVDGPLWWPDTNGGRALDRVWRKTVRVVAPDPIGGAATLEWLS